MAETTDLNAIVTMYGPALDDPAIIVSRQVKEKEVGAWVKAGYQRGTLPEEHRDANKAYWQKKAKDLDGELAEIAKAEKAETKKGKAKDAVE